MWLGNSTTENFRAVILSSFLLWPAIAQTAYSSAPIPPSQDPFYSAPFGFESFVPGTVFKIRIDPSNITSVVNCSAAYNILYRSTDSRYQPSWAVTTLLIPHSGLISDRSTPRILSYQVAYNSPDVDASPSYLLSTLFTTGWIHPPIDDIKAAISRGWYVNIPDHEGPLAAFLAGPQEGHAVLDSIRAVLSQNQLADWGNARYALWGYSGGSLASFFAAELQASYAPELSFVGAALGGIPSNITQIFQTVNSGPGSGLIISSLLGITAQYPKARDYLISNLKTEGPLNATGFLACLHYDIKETVANYVDQDIFQYFVNGKDILNAPELAHVAANNAFPTYHGIPQMPLFAYVAINDGIVGIEYADSHIQRYCDADVDILYQRIAVGDHDYVGHNGAPLALAWLTRWFDQNTEQKIIGCTVETITI